MLGPAKFPVPGFHHPVVHGDVVSQKLLSGGLFKCVFVLIWRGWSKGTGRAMPSLDMRATVPVLEGSMKAPATGLTLVGAMGRVPERWSDMLERLCDQYHLGRTGHLSGGAVPSLWRNLQGFYATVLQRRNGLVVVRWGGVKLLGGFQLIARVLGGL